MQKSIHASEYIALVRVMRRMREAKGLSQADVATRLGITASQLSKWERRERRVDLRELRLYCLALGEPLVDLVKMWEKELEG